MSIFTEAKLNEVFLRVARFPNESKHAFIHAPFDRVQILGQYFCQPRSCGIPSGGANVASQSFWLNNDSFDRQEDKADGRDLWYTELNPIVLDGHELGGFDARPDDWVGCFAMDLI